MPFKCTHYRTGESYQYETLEQRKRWIELRDGHPTGVHWEDQLKAGWSVWVNPDTNEPWIPTDVHSSTSLKALQIMGFDISKMTKDELKWWRNIGKRFNFMRNYGGGDAKAAETLEIELEQAKAMNRGYSEAFPLVVTYQRMVEKAMFKKGYAQSPSGRRYYLSESWRFYKVGNYLIQGWSADMLKKKLLEIDRYLEQNPCSIRVKLYVHDEVQFSVPDPADDHHMRKIQDIMEDLPEVMVPIVAEMEMTETNWASKKKVI
jgi:DNA polymerase-1